MPDRQPCFLLVEDDDDHAYLVERTLGSVDVNLVRVSDGEAALDYLYARPPYADAVRPDVVLLDLNLPKFSGLEVLERLKTDRSLSQLPVVVLTSSSAAVDRDQAYGNHANSFLVKPVDFGKFRRLVEDLSHYWGRCNVPPIARGTA